ncbi:MAG: rod shape-determining protein RodA [Firmicutes bacterium]|nr:rod shape-determining protein RodA [Bacillota bacterium]
MFERRMLKNLDLVLLLAVFLVMAIGLAMIASASHTLSGNTSPYYYVKRQAMMMGVGLIIMALVLTIDYHTMAHYAVYLYIANIAMLLAVLLVPAEAKGAGRWIDLGFFRLQPSEFAKVFLIITLANFLAKTMGDMTTLMDLVPVLIHVALPMVLIMAQPDLGTSLVFVAILLGLLFLTGIKMQYIFTLILAGGASLPILWKYLKDYQKNRLLVFLDPNIDPTGSGYHVIQSMIAIGSGRMLGQGFLAGPQNQLNFIPEQHTDFIYSVVGEELGFLGAGLLLLLYFIIIYRGIRIAINARDMLGTIMAGGVVTMLLFQVMVNVGMTICIMPITGLPLPLLSYGGSSLLSTLLAIGLLLNVGMRRQKILF